MLDQWIMASLTLEDLTYQAFSLPSPFSDLARHPDIEDKGAAKRARLDPQGQGAGGVEKATDDVPCIVTESAVPLPFSLLVPSPSGPASSSALAVHPPLLSETPAASSSSSAATLPSVQLRLLMQGGSVSDPASSAPDVASGGPGPRRVGPAQPELFGAFGLNNPDTLNLEPDSGDALGRSLPDTIRMLYSRVCRRRLVFPVPHPLATAGCEFRNKPPQFPAGFPHIFSFITLYLSSPTIHATFLAPLSTLRIASKWGHLFRSRCAHTAPAWCPLATPSTWSPCGCMPWPTVDPDGPSQRPHRNGGRRGSRCRSLGESNSLPAPLGTTQRDLAKASGLLAQCCELRGAGGGALGLVDWEFGIFVAKHWQQNIHTICMWVWLRGE